MLFDHDIWEEYTGNNSSYQKRIYRFYIRRLENLSNNKLEEEFQATKSFLVKNKIIKPRLLREAISELEENGWPMLKMTAYLKVLSLEQRT